MGDDDVAALFAASDERLAAVILASTGIPATRHDLARWRSALSRRLHRARRVRESDPPPPPPPSRYPHEAWRDLIGDFLGSPEGSLLIATIAVAAIVPPALVAAARAAWGLRATAAGVPPDDLARAHAYAVAKSAPGGAGVADYWIAARLDPAVLAAINVATPDRLSWIVARLASARAAGTPPDVALHALRRDGGEIIATYDGFDLGTVSYGPPLGVWPPPPATLDDPDPGAAPATRQ